MKRGGVVHRRIFHITNVIIFFSDDVLSSSTVITTAKPRDQLTPHRQSSSSRYGLHGVGGVTLVVSPVTGLHISNGQHAVPMVGQARVQPNLLQVLGPTEGRPGVTSCTTDELDCLPLYRSDVLWLADEGGGD